MDELIALNALIDDIIDDLEYIKIKCRFHTVK